MTVETKYASDAITAPPPAGRVRRYAVLGGDCATGLAHFSHMDRDVDARQRQPRRPP
jgi:hypothetical protein